MIYFKLREFNFELFRVKIFKFLIKKKKKKISSHFQGVHISKIRSLNLDDLDNETLTLLMSTGNTAVNEIYESRAPKLQNGLITMSNLDEIENSSIERATPKCDSQVRENWIRAKYVTKSFVKQMLAKLIIRVTSSSKLEIIRSNGTEESSSSNDNETGIVHIDTSNDLLHLASAYGDLRLIMYALALDAERNSIIDRMDFYSNVTSDEKTLEDIQKGQKSFGYTPLIKAVRSGSISAVELLLLNGAKLTICDFNGQSPLHHATILKDLPLVCLLLKRGADPLALDKYNIDPIQIATENCQANIVTM